MNSEESKGATVEQKALGVKGHGEHLEDALGGMLLAYLRTQARLDAVLKAIRTVAEGRAPFETLNPFLSEQPRLPRLEEITTKLRKVAEATTGSS